MPRGSAKRIRGSKPTGLVTQEQGNGVKPFRIFLASPGDVVEERKLAGEVFTQLRHERAFRDDLNLQNFAWDQPGNNIAMPMGITPQQAISQGLMQPCDSDLVIIILWSRMGTPLPPEYAKPDGSPYLSGTEWEYWNAMEAFQKHGRPRIWMYRREGPPKVDLGDADLHEKREQWERLQKFLGMIRNPDGSIAHGVNPYADPGGFQRHLEQHLRDELVRFLDESASTRALEEDLHGSAEEQPELEAPKSSKRNRRPSSNPNPQTEINPEPIKAVAPDLPFTHLGETGKDKFGHWLRWDYGDIDYVFRWIPPGRFWMTSPNTEPECGEDEILIEIKHKQGFWLGETVVTQTLWEAMDKTNPSEIKGEELPVAWVERDVIKKLLRRLRRKYPKVPFNLPKEAEWEYARCAGTCTPFARGSDTDRTVVKSGGYDPYSDPAKNPYRQQMIRVKTLPPNRWGLYDMYGNIREWCSDGMIDFDLAGGRDALIAHKGPTGLLSRMLSRRAQSGGSSLARLTAALKAARSENMEYSRRPIGFRLVLRSPVQRGSEGR